MPSRLAAKQNEPEPLSNVIANTLLKNKGTICLDRASSFPRPRYAIHNLSTILNEENLTRVALKLAEIMTWIHIPRVSVIIQRWEGDKDSVKFCILFFLPSSVLAGHIDIKIPGQEVVALKSLLFKEGVQLVIVADRLCPDFPCMVSYFICEGEAFSIVYLLYAAFDLSCRGIITVAISAVAETFQIGENRTGPGFDNRPVFEVV